MVTYVDDYVAWHDKHWRIKWQWPWPKSRYKEDAKLMLPDKVIYEVRLHKVGCHDIVEEFSTEIKAYKFWKSLNAWYGECRIDRAIIYRVTHNAYGDELCRVCRAVRSKFIDNDK